MIEAGNYLIPVKEIEYVELYNKREFYIYLKSGKKLTVTTDNELCTFNSVLIQFNMIGDKI